VNKSASYQTADSAMYQGLEKAHLRRETGDETHHCHHRGEKPPSCFRGCPWLCRGEMRFHS